MVLHGDLQDANDAFANSQQYIPDSDGDVESLNGSIYGNATDAIADSSALQLGNFHTRQSAPPAALWLRGSATTMDERNLFSPSTLSISDEYDIVDDAETASLPSSGSESDDASDTVEGTHDEKDYSGEAGSKMRSAKTSFQTIEPKASPLGHDVYDSMLSEDIETPRQSLWTPHKDPTNLTSDQFLRKLLIERPLHIVYFCKSHGVEGKEEGLFKVMASRLSGAGTDNVGHARVIELPSRPNDRFSDSTDVVYRSGFVDLHVRRIVSENNMGANNVKLQSNDDLAVFHVTESDLNTPWVLATLRQLSASLFPILIVLEKSLEQDISSIIRNVPTELATNVVSENTLLQDSTSEFLARINTIMVNEIGTAITDLADSFAGPEIENPKPTKSRCSLAKLRPVLTTLILTLLATAFSSYYMPSRETHHEARHDLLTVALTQHMADIQVSALNLTHLLQPVEMLSKSRSGPRLHEQKLGQQGMFITANPNHIVVSVPSLSRHGIYPKVSAVEVWKGSHKVAHNCTRLIDGVYSVDIDPSFAHGLVMVNVLAKPPMLNLTIEANFGHQIFRRAGYDKARSDLSVAVRKDLVVVSTNAKAFKAAVEADLKSGISAAKDVTGQLTEQVFRDLPGLVARTAKQVEDLYRSQKSLIVVNTQNAVQLLRPDNVIQEMRTAYEQWIKQAAKAVVPAETIALARERVLAIKKAGRFAEKGARKLI